MTAPPFQPLDWIVLALYFALTLGIGLRFYGKTRSAEGYTTGNRSVPGWVCGLSIFATFLSSISYLALPGKSFAADWNPFVFSLAIPLVAVVAVRWFLPHYRRGGEVSAYALLERRFGVWARVYASVFYLLTQIARAGVVLYLMALPMQVIFGWNIDTILVVTGIVVTFYSFAGGILAVIWTDAIQAIVLLAGAVLCLAIMMGQIPGGMAEVVSVAAANGKFSLGDFGGSLTAPTFWVVLVYGVAINLQNFGIDQSYVQRYIASSSDREARRSVWLGALLYVPVSALFFFIGTALWVGYGAGTGESTADLEGVRAVVARQQVLQAGVSPDDAGFEERAAAVAAGLDLADIGDRVFPHFIATHLPAGVTGLLVAAVFAAAMSTVSTSLNSSATLLMNDFFKRFLRPEADERETMLVLYGGTVVWGVLGTALALVLVRLTQSALDMWWTLAGIFGGGMTGLFLLGLVSRRAGNAAALSGVTAGICVILWLSLPSFVPGWEAPVHAFLVPVFGTAVILLVGMAAGRIRSKPATHGAS